MSKYVSVLLILALTRKAFVEVMLKCILDKQRGDVEAGGSEGEVVDDIDWKFGQMYESNEEEFCDVVRKLLAYVAPGGDALLSSAKIDMEADRKLDQALAEVRKGLLGCCPKLRFVTT